jgi:predicted unusual protein kinase regulating ubiquinone biosynthesis (AarF/ABC1/UbiB family)
VKVLRPWLASQVRQDLPVLERLLAPLDAAFPALDSHAVLREFRERVLDELDLEHEACTQRLVHRALRGHPSLMAPAPVMRLAHEGVLVSEWANGTPLLDGPDADNAAARLVELALGATRAGIMPADIDPDDVLLLSDGRLAILDFGAWCAVDRERASIAADALEAFLEPDVEAFGSAVERLGWLPAGHGGAALDLIGDALDGLAGPGPARLDRESVLAARDRLFESPETIVELILAGALPPHDLWPARGVAQLFGTIARAGATGDWPALARTALRNGWSAPPLRLERRAV